MQKGQSNQQSSEKDLHGHMKLQDQRALHGYKRLCSYGKHGSNELLEEMCQFSRHSGRQEVGSRQRHYRARLPSGTMYLCMA